jgi:uncharacterized protein YbjT (DUF2867 family)
MMRLVAGATGYVGGALARRLIADGVPVRALARSRARAVPLAEMGAEVTEGDVLELESLRRGLEGIEVAYYLVHSMGRGGDRGFAERDRLAAGNFGRAAAEAGVRQIVYLGGLAEAGSEHLRSRHESAEHLAEAGVPVTYFQAAAVIGSGSESFRTVYYLVRRLPVMVTPRWTATRTQPIAIGDVISYLAAAPGIPEATGRTIEIGGPEVTTYGGMMEAMAEAMDRRAPLQIPVPFLTPKLSSLWIGLVTPVDAGVARPLVEGLSVETVVGDESGMALFKVERTPMREAMRRAVAELDALAC